MRHLAFVLAVTVLAGCASMEPVGSSGPASEPAPQRGAIEALPPQTLDSGECGLFFWTSDAPHRFVLFVDENARRAKIVHEGASHELDIPAPNPGYLPGDRVELVYPDPAHDLVFTLTGQVGEQTRSGARIARALLKARHADGREIVRPLLGVRSCRSEMPLAPGG